jgi:hypothetical protein
MQAVKSYEEEYQLVLPEPEECRRRTQKSSSERVRKLEQKLRTAFQEQAVQ